MTLFRSMMGRLAIFSDGKPPGPRRSSMDYELEASTKKGERLVTLAERLAADFATRAEQHDRDGSYPFENIDALRSSGFFWAPFPLDCGGLGVESVHDILVASSRLARGDASVTLGVNMHLLAVLRLARSWRQAVRKGDHARAAAKVRTMEHYVRSGATIVSATSEPNQDLTRPHTTATRNGTGWIINGRKIFGTMSPAATQFNVSVTYQDDDGTERITWVPVPARTPGIRVHDDWDALGMRASGSGSLSFEDVHVSDSALSGGFPTGSWSPELIEHFLAAGPMHASASLGIAEAAVALVTELVCSRPKGRNGQRLVDRPMIQMLAAENAVDLSAMRAAFGRAGMLIDRFYAEHPLLPAPLSEVLPLFTEVQSAKAFVHSAAIRIVDRALTMSGGAGYMNKHPLSRLYRDVRAGPFMNPLSATSAYEFIGRTALGLEPIAA
jgi:alkylation response protein AidB-like acyl-CoA dehydrogenase